MSSLLLLKIKEMKKKLKVILFNVLIGLIIGIIFFLIYYLIRFNMNLAIASDGLFLAGFFVFIIGLLSYVNNEGFFDSISYGFSVIPYSLNIKKEKKYKDLYEYKEKKEKNRKENKLSPLGYIFISLIFLLIALILYFCK